MLHKLPPEILEMVAQSLTSKQDLKSLSLVSRALPGAVYRTLWSSLDLWPIEEDRLWRFNPKPVFHANLPAFTRPTELNFYSTISFPLGERCVHCEDREGPYADNELRVDSRFNCLSGVARSIIEKFPPRRLRKFTWGLGTCIPGGIFGRHGILACRQPQLSSLDLTTVGDCMDWPHIDLSSFDRLTEFRWRAPRSHDFEAITNVLRTNRKHLTSLELDFVDWDFLSDEEPKFDDIEGMVMDGYFHTNILSIPTHAVLEEPLFPALVSLSLSSVPLLGRTARAFDFTTLQSLTIRKCPQWDRFLAEIPKFGVPVRLKSLEVHEKFDFGRPTTTKAPEHIALLDFITSFTGLEELFLSLGGPMDAIAFWEKMVKQHGPTLKRFVHHLCSVEHPGQSAVIAGYNRIQSREYTLSGPQIYEIPDFDLAPKLGQLSEENPLANIYQPESIGISCIPEILGPMFCSLAKSHTDNPSLKLIHVRQSRTVAQCSGSIWTSAGSLGTNPAILLPLSYHENFQTNARYRVPLNWSIYKDMAQEADKQSDHKYERELEINWVNEAKLIADLARKGKSFLFSKDYNGNNNIRDSSPSCLAREKPKFAIRHSLIRFATWAFGPQGIPSLEVIACGDFAHGRWDGREGTDNAFLIRNRNQEDGEGQKLNFSICRPGEMGHGTLQRQKDGHYLTGIPTIDHILEKNRRFLEACPMEPLMDYDRVDLGPYPYLSDEWQERRWSTE
ncbi:hypothetical protein V8F20_009813 [Naviculisporaceae sp. PSN 640]